MLSFCVRDILMLGKSVNELRRGDQAEFSKTVSESDIYLYAGITGDLIQHMSIRFIQRRHISSHVLHMAVYLLALYLQLLGLFCLVLGQFILSKN